MVAPLQWLIQAARQNETRDDTRKRALKDDAHIVIESEPAHGHEGAKTLIV
jgi:hypothetical protein